MSLKCGIVGLPNVGKSTFFNAITKTMQAEAANYPFCTIEPNEARVYLEDERLLKLAELAGSAEIIPNFLEIVDIAGLVKGASKGEGLGNKFLSHIREVDLIIHIVRCFDDENIVHVENRVNPVSDAEIINTELILADIDSITNIRLRNAKKMSKEVDETLGEMLDFLNSGKPVREFLKTLTEERKELLKPFNFITSKPVIYIANVGEESVTEGNDFSKQMEEFAKKEAAEFGIISVKIESEISAMQSEEERKNFLEMMGLSESGLNKLAKLAFRILNLITYFTIGPKEARAWTIKKGTLAPKAAGVIHTDFEKGFIRAEVISYQDYIEYQGEAGVKEAGKFRVEGKEYIMTDGDVVHFRFNT
jgi:GTP-binding protein YchF